MKLDMSNKCIADIGYDVRQPIRRGDLLSEATNSPNPYGAGRTMLSLQHTLALSFSVLVGACSVPAQWAKDLPYKLQCGMSAEQVFAAAGHDIPAPSEAWHRDVLGSELGRTIVKLQYDGQGLRSMQPIWIAAPIGMDIGIDGPVFEFCTDSGS